MNHQLTHRKATQADLPHIVGLLRDDELGQSREDLKEDDFCYRRAFELIDRDPNQYLMVVEMDGRIVGTCHLTLMPSLTFKGSMRMHIEAVRVHSEYRGQKIGEWMMKEAICYAREQGASIVQLTTNKVRVNAQKFYQRLGFEPSHDGMKLFI